MHAGGPVRLPATQDIWAYSTGGTIGGDHVGPQESPSSIIGFESQGPSFVKQSANHAQKETPLASIIDRQLPVVAVARSQSVGDDDEPVTVFVGDDWIATSGRISCPYEPRT